jgi:hypothetical protein
MNEGTEYVTLESALAAISYMVQFLKTEGDTDYCGEAEALLVKRTFKTVGRAQELKGTAGAFTQAVFEGKDVKENDWLCVEVKQQ